MILKWLPRILAILLICFIGLFSLDVFSMEGTVLQKTGGFLIHNIPTFILIISLFFAWKKEKIGAILFILIGIVSTLYFHTYQQITTFILLTCLPLAIGILFLGSAHRRRK
jgi:hypothetical protein